MKERKLIAGVAGLSVAAALAVGAVGSAGAAGTAPSTVTVKEKWSVKMVPNRYIQDGMRFDRDVYNVKSGGTLVFKMTAPEEGPHTLTVLAPKDVPKTAQAAFNCKICNKLAKAHGADPNSNGPPKFLYLENGVGSKNPPHLDRPGDSAVLFPKPGALVKMKVTAKSGTTLRFICLIHPWMQARIKVQ
jgi:uncharacterized cupredoxin-like copper-binding protein